VNAGSLRLLVLASRPSDYVEMSALARGLADLGHKPTLIYFYAPSDPGSEPIIRNIEVLGRTPGLAARAMDIDEVQRGEPNQGPAAAVVEAERSQAVEVGVYKLVLLLRDRVLGRRVALALRRRLPTVRRFFPVVYKVARAVDMVRNLPAGMRMATRAIKQRLQSSREMPLSFRLKVMVMGPKVVTDAVFMEQIYRRFLAFFRDTIATAQSEALLIPEDIVGNVWPVSIKAAHQAGIPALVFPYTLANKEEAFQSLKGEAPYQTSRNQIAAVLYPRWRLIEAGADLVRLPSAHIFAHERLGIAPPDPWMMNSGFADCICVDSQAGFEYFHAGGIPADQMRVVGSISQDQMAVRRANRDAHLAELRTALKLTGTKPVLLISGCPNQLAASVPFCEFSSIGEVAAFVGESVAPLADHYHCVVRPHPNYPEFGALLQPFGVVTSMAPTADLVPLADAFIAFASATIRWAIACGVPTVNYDVFHYGYGDFASATGVATVKGSTEFRGLVRALVPGSPQLAEQSARARADSAHWSVMDGKSLIRIGDEIVQARARRAAMSKKEQLQHA
jgi:hypothetical protein